MAAERGDRSWFGARTHLRSAQGRHRRGPLPAISRVRPATARRTMPEIVEAALVDAGAYAEGGIDGLIIENHGDIPFLRPGDIGPETAALMAVDHRPGARRDRAATGHQRARQRGHRGPGGRQGGRGRIHPRQPVGECLCRQRRIRRGRCCPRAALPRDDRRRGRGDLRRQPREARRACHHRRPQRSRS